MADATDTERAAAIRELFKLWDLDGNGCVEYGEMQQILQASQRVSTKDHLKWIKKFEAEINQGQRDSKRGSMSRINVKGGGQINFSEIDGEPSLDPDAFVSFLLRLTRKDSDAEFDELVEFSKKWIEDAASATQGNKLKREIWEIFQLLDTNKDGFVDWAELEVLLNAERRADRKIVLKWKAVLRNKAGVQMSLPARRVTPRAYVSAPEGASTTTTRAAGQAAAEAAGSAEQAHAEAHDDEEDDETDKRRLKMDLRDFQQFLHEYVEVDPETRVPELLTLVRKAAQEQRVRYIVQYRVHDIINDIMEDLLKEQPQDVLAGIEKSVARLQRLQKFPKPLRKIRE